MADAAAPAASSGELRKALGLPALTFYGVGCILGAGVYSVIGVAAGQAGEALWLAFLVAAAAALLTGLSYVELSTMMPRAAAEYVFAKEAFPRPRFVRFAAGSLVALSDTATAATVSIAFAGYLARWVDLPAWSLALGLLAAAVSLNVAGIEVSSRLNIVFTSIEAAGLALVIALGFARPEFGQAVLAEPTFGVAGAAALLFYSYLGFEGIANLGEEARNPARDLPRAVLLSILVTTVLYVLVGLAVVALLPPERLAGSSAPLAEAAAAASPRMAGVLGGIALFATANTALIAVLVGSRLLFGMARGGDMPRPFARILRSRGSPWIATLAVGAAAALLVPAGKLEAVAGLSSVGALTAFALVNLCVIVLRRREPARRRPFRVPWAVRDVPLPAAAGIAATLALATQFGREAYLAAGVAAAVLTVLYATRRWWPPGTKTQRER